MTAVASPGQKLTMNCPAELDNESFDIKDGEEVISLVKGLVNGRHPGILCTIGLDGKPAVRWMSTLAFDDFPVFYTLTAPGSRKVAQIQTHPAVTWMFFNHNRSLILNLTGKARILTETRTLKRVWQHVENKSHTYFLNQYAKGPGFVVVETTVESIECSSPQNGLRFTVTPGELAPAAPGGRPH